MDPNIVRLGDSIRVHFMYVGVAWVGPWLIGLEGARVRIMDPYIVRLGDYIRVHFIYVGVAWVGPWLIDLEGEYVKWTLIKS